MVDFDREQAEQGLYERMLAELNTFRNSLLKLSSSEIISNYNSYKLVYTVVYSSFDLFCNPDGILRIF